MAIVIQIELDERGNIANLKRLEKELENVGKSGKTATGGLNDLDNAIDRAARRYLNLGAAAYAVKRSLDIGKEVGINFTNTAMQFESMKVTLETITRGRGKEWFEDLNKWALKMPVTTQGAVQGFIRLRAMGLQPTIEQMTILTDATAALGGHSDTFDGLVLAMGQIYSKGQLMSQELRQLAERGIPAYEILQQKLGLTATELESTNHAAIRADVALKALFEGMAERYGGLSQKMMNETGMGIKEQLIGNWTEFKRVMMDSGPYSFVKRQMQDIADGVANVTATIAAANNKAKTIAYMRALGMKPAGNWSDPASMFPTGNYNEYSPEQIAMGAQLRYDRDKALRSYKDRMDALKAEGDRLSPNNQTPVIPLFERDESYFKRRQKRMAEEYEYWAKLDKEYSGLRTQSAESAELEKYDYFRRLLAEYEQKDLYAREENLDKARDAAEDYWREQERKAKEFQNEIIYIGETWAWMFERAALSGGNFVDNMLNELGRLATSTAIRSTVTGIVSMLTGNTFGFGVTSYLSSIPGIGSLFGAGKAAGGYTGDQMGLYHPHEYVSNARTVDYFGRGVFDLLAKIAANNGGGNSGVVMNNYFSAAEKAAMVNESDEMLVRRLERLVEERRIKVAS